MTNTTREKCCEKWPVCSEHQPRMTVHSGSPTENSRESIEFKRLVPEEHDILHVRSGRFGYRPVCSRNALVKHIAREREHAAQEAYKRGKGETIREIQERVRSMKGILWHEDVNEHNRRIARENTINEILAALNERTD